MNIHDCVCRSVFKSPICHTLMVLRGLEIGWESEESPHHSDTDRNTDSHTETLTTQCCIVCFKYQRRVAHLFTCYLCGWCGAFEQTVIFCCSLLLIPFTANITGWNVTSVVPIGTRGSVSVKICHCLLTNFILCQRPCRKKTNRMLRRKMSVKEKVRASKTNFVSLFFFFLCNHLHSGSKPY